MSKVFLFRKIVNPTELQSKVFEEAKESLVSHIMKGATGTVLNYGKNLDYDNDWNEGNIGDTSSGNNIMQHIIFDLFNHVYTMELIMEINISIKHYEFDPSKHHDFINFNEEYQEDSLEGSGEREQFVSTPKDVFEFIEKKLKRSNDVEIGFPESLTSLPFSLFVLKVNQTNLEKSKKRCGALHILHLADLHATKFLDQQYKPTDPPLTQRPVTTLFKIIKTLSGNTKTHKRYYNVRLIRVLRDIVGSRENTVIINFVNKLENTEDANEEHEHAAEEWRELYEKERQKYNSLMQKIAGCTCGCISESDKLMCSPSNSSLSSFETTQGPLLSEIQHLRAELLKKNNDIQYYREKCSKSEASLQEQEAILNQALTEQVNMRKEMDEIKSDVDITLEELNEVHHVVDQLALAYEHTANEVEKKDKMLEKLNVLLRKNNEEMIRQKMLFHDKLQDFSDMFTKLWQQQTELMASQEERRKTQLAEIFVAIAKEVEQIHNRQLEQIKLEALGVEGELKNLHRRHNDLINGGGQKEAKPTKEK